MGIPKYYRWISERYPCLSRVVQQHEVPTFDCLYLDMNGIIHTCSHPNDNDPNFRITEEKIFEEISKYIELLFRIVRPRRVFYMAVDGCAPRAKMNQQRARRFRSAREAADARAKAERTGKLVETDEAPFDSNCITPGTPFMHRLQQHLQHWVHVKITTDPAWQGIRVILSGHETPGEGEHKIMDFIRSEKRRSDYDPHTRHCLYGLDADLIILGLLSHEPHFTLLREEVKFGRASQKRSSAEETKFHLLSLSLYREYLAMEFGDLRETIDFDFDIERIIDDWVLLGFLVGNDFLPHLPGFHINEDILPRMYDVYKSVLPTLEGYITEGGIINTSRLEELLNSLAKFDALAFDEAYADLKYMQSKTGRKKQDKDQPVVDITRPDTDEAEEDEEEGDQRSAGPGKLSSRHQVSHESKHLLALFGSGPVVDDEDDAFEEESEDEQDLFDMEFLMHKANYYREKLGVEVYNDEFIQHMAETYVTGLQWVLLYYYRGVPSWSWFFPYHYAPYVSDIRGIGNFTPTFDLGRPFLPFQQLLSVLPPASKTLLPAAYQPLMTDSMSPIIDFYPENFDTDLNGKTADWEAVVLIPFIEQDRLIEAMTQVEHNLTKEERSRNRHSDALEFTTRPDDATSFVASPLPHLGDISSKAQVKMLPWPHISSDAPYVGKLNSTGELFFPGFPTFRHHHYTFLKCAAKVKVFNFPSKSDSIIVKLQNEHVHRRKDSKPGPHGASSAVPPVTPKELIDIAKTNSILAKAVWVRWPHLLEAFVVELSCATHRLFYNAKQRKFEIAAHGADEKHKWEQEAQDIKSAMYFGRGLDVGPVRILVHVRHSQGRARSYKPDGTIAYSKVWSHRHTKYPLQTLVTGIQVHEDAYNVETETMEQRFKLGLPFCFLGHPNYGAMGKIEGVQGSRLKVELHVASQPDTVRIVASNKAARYVHFSQASNRIGLPISLINRLTASLYVYAGTSKKPGDKFDIGLKLKFSKKNQQVVGYTKREENGAWMLSEKAIELIEAYFKAFPNMFLALAAHPNADSYYAEDILPPGEGAHMLRSVKKFIGKLPTSKAETVPCGTDALSSDTIQALHEAQQQHNQVATHKTIHLPGVQPQLLYMHDECDRTIGKSPDPSAKFHLGDRVVHVRDVGTVPWGMHGTVVGIYGGDTDDIEVLFDHHFLGGITLGGRCPQGFGYRLPTTYLVNLSHGWRAQGLKGPPAAAMADNTAKANGAAPAANEGQSKPKGQPASKPTTSASSSSNDSSSAAPPAQTKVQAASDQDESSQLAFMFQKLKMGQAGGSAAEPSGLQGAGQPQAASSSHAAAKSGSTASLGSGTSDDAPFTLNSLLETMTQQSSAESTSSATPSNQAAASAKQADGANKQEVQEAAYVAPLPFSSANLVKTSSAEEPPVTSSATPASSAAKSQAKGSANEQNQKQVSKKDTQKQAKQGKAKKAEAVQQDLSGKSHVSLNGNHYDLDVLADLWKQLQLKEAAKASTKPEGASSSTSQVASKRRGSKDKPTKASQQGDSRPQSASQQQPGKKKGGKKGKASGKTDKGDGTSTKSNDNAANSATQHKEGHQKKPAVAAQDAHGTSVSTKKKNKRKTSKESNGSNASSA